MNKQGPRIVIRRKRSHVSVKHNDSWKIAYADFVTAMMAFFLVMWLVALVPQKDLQEMAEYFRMPLMTAVKGGPKNDTGRSVIPSGNPSIIPNPRDRKIVEQAKSVAVRVDRGGRRIIKKTKK